MGFDAVLLKPAAPADLITAVGSSIERRRGEPSRNASTAA
jgi:hypothetical protein